MKRYVPVLTLGLFLYFLPGIAAGQQPNVVMEEVICNSVSIDEQCTVDKVVVRGEYIHQLLQASDLSLDTLHGEYNEEELSEPLTFVEAIDITIKVLELKGINISYFKQENQQRDDQLSTAYSLGLIEAKPSTDDQTLFLNAQRASKIIDNVLVLLNSPPESKNALGVSYTVKPLNVDTILLELRWGKKPSSGYNIEVVNTQYQGDTLYVNYVTTKPKPGAAYLTVITYPRDTVIVKGSVPQRVILYQLN